MALVHIGDSIGRFNVTANGQLANRTFTADIGMSVDFFRTDVILKGDLAANDMGLYNIINTKGKDYVRFGWFEGFEHLVQPKSYGCTFNPVGTGSMKTSKIGLCEAEINLTWCPEDLRETCWGGVFGRGGTNQEFLNSPTGTALFAEMMQHVYYGIGNSFWDVIQFGQHPLIDVSDENDWYYDYGTCQDDKEWEQFKNQQTTCKGLVTWIDELKTNGQNKHLNVLINEDDVDITYNSDGSIEDCEYVGDVEQLFNKMLRARTGKMKQTEKQQTASGQELRSIFVVDDKIFDTYSEQLMDKHSGNIPEAFHYKLTGSLCAQIGCDNSRSLNGVLMYRGHWVICQNAWQTFYDKVGVKSCRAMLVTPGIFGIGWNINEATQYTNGMGLIMQQSSDIKDKGRIDMLSCFSLTAHIVDHRFLVNASAIIKPQAA